MVRVSQLFEKGSGRERVIFIGSVTSEESNITLVTSEEWKHYEFTYQNEDNSFTLPKIILGVPGRAFWPRHDAQSALKKRPGRACARPVPSLMLTMKSETLSEVALQQEKATQPHTQTPSGSQVRSVRCTDHRSLRHQIAPEQGRSLCGSSWRLFRGPAGPLGTTPHPCSDV